MVRSFISGVAKIPKIGGDVPPFDYDTLYRDPCAAIPLKFFRTVCRRSTGDIVHQKRFGV